MKKFDAPKATLMSYIIKGILDRQLPWALVLLGVMIAVVLEMAGVPSLAFAVGVYLPLVSTAPILVGGVIRWLVDRRNNKLRAQRRADDEEQQAAGDSSPGVLLASGYIAGGAIAGIIIAITAGVLTNFDTHDDQVGGGVQSVLRGRQLGPAVADPVCCDHGCCCTGWRARSKP